MEVSSAVILVTRQGSLEDAVQAMHLGAQDYVTRPDDAETMRRAVHRALTHRRAERRAMPSTAFTDRQVERQIHDMRVLSAMGRRMLSVLEWEKLLPRIVDAAVYLTAASESSLALVNEATGDLHVLAAKSATEEQAHCLQPQPEVNASAMQALNSGQPVLVHNHGEPSRSYLHVPIKVGDIVIGVISTGQKVEGLPFDDHDVSAYQVMEEQARQRAIPPSPPHPTPAPETGEISPSALLQVLQTQGQEIRNTMRSATRLAQELRQQVAIVWNR